MTNLAKIATDSFFERPVNQYKTFYKTYLYNLKNKDKIIEELQFIVPKFKKIEPKDVRLHKEEIVNLKRIANDFINKYFSKELISLYNKELPKIKTKREYTPTDQSSFWLSLLVSFTQAFEDLNEQMKQEWNYKTNFLTFLYECLISYGLHPNILKRNPVTEKKFNLVIYHYYKSKAKETEIRTMLTYGQFDKEFMIPYMKQKSVKVIGKLIPFKSIYEVKITTTFLKDDEITLFALKNNFKWNDKEKDIISFVDNCIDETELYHPSPFEENTHNKGINFILIEETKQWLYEYPDSFKLYMEAMNKFDQGHYERNLLDDLRLALETLLRSVLNNTKSLENQLSEVGNYQKKRGATNEATNMLHKLLDYYMKYQNTYVKHNDKVQKNEIEFIIDLTTTFMKYLIKND